MPDIVVDKTKDREFIATKRHFHRLFAKYSSPIFALNLTKATNPREETVAAEYRIFVRKILNRELPDEKKVTFLDWDMKEKKKNSHQRYELEMIKIAGELLNKTNFFSCLPKLQEKTVKSQFQI